MCYVLFAPVINELQLNAHSASQDTAKTPKYALVHDDSYIFMNVVEEMAYDLSYLHDVVTATVSVLVPLIVADHCAKRAHNVYTDNSNQRDAVVSIEEANERFANKCDMQKLGCYA
ncbi:hypothetical protein Aduo_012304 [Ancylostoma duodenale]